MNVEIDGLLRDWMLTFNFESFPRRRCAEGRQKTGIFRLRLAEAASNLAIHDSMRNVGSGREQRRNGISRTSSARVCVSHNLGERLSERLEEGQVRSPYGLRVRAWLRWRTPI